MAKQDFIDQLQALGYKTEEPRPGFISCEYEIPVGRFIGKKVTIAFQVDDSFPMTPPPGPHFRPHLLPVTGGGGQHPFGAIHASQIGQDWQYWSRPFTAHWNTSDRTVRTYLGHIKNLLATIPIP